MTTTDARTDQLDDWPEISDHDHEYLTGPRNWPQPCPWCRGRLAHNPLCVTHDWEVVLLFGKHKGTKISSVPLDYLRWLLQNGSSLNAELREAINNRVQGGRA
jgi:hypothetical protein